MLNNGPWTFDKELIILEEPNASQRSVELGFKNVDLWIKLINLPMGFRNKVEARKIGNSIGKFLEIGERNEDLIWGQSVRIRVRIDICKPLIRGFMLKATGIEGNCWVTIRYEKHLEIYYNVEQTEEVRKENSEVFIRRKGKEPLLASQNSDGCNLEYGSIREEGTSSWTYDLNTTIEGGLDMNEQQLGEKEKIDEEMRMRVGKRIN